jgi:S-adenosylmethionine synthetase
MCKCAIKWINNQGLQTDDNNDAIALAVCYDPLSFGEKGSEAILICEKHAKEKSKFWKLYPLPGQDIKSAHILVQKDIDFNIIPDIVTQAIKDAFKYDYKEILQSLLRWSGDHYSFNKWGMYVGVELDGYIHT